MRCVGSSCHAAFIGRAVVGIFVKHADDSYLRRKLCSRSELSHYHGATRKITHAAATIIVLVFAYGIYRGLAGLIREQLEVKNIGGF